MDVGVTEDGKCAVDFENYEETLNRWHPTDDVFFYYFGYGSLDDLFNDTVKKMKNDYAYKKL